LSVGKFSVTNAEIVRRRGYDKIDMFILNLRHSFDAIFPMKIKVGHGKKFADVVRFVQRKL